MAAFRITPRRRRLQGRHQGEGVMTKPIPTWLALALGGTMLAGAAIAADPPKGSMADMPGMSGSGHMSMGLPLGPMPSVYAGEADKPGAPVFAGLGAHKHPISTR